MSTIEDRSKVLTLGIVGGGRGGLEMLKVFAGSEMVKVVYLVDRDTQAIGMVEAKARGVSTQTDLVAAVKGHRTDFIIEATGSEKVYELIKENLQPGTELVSSKASLMFYNVLAENRRKTNQAVFSEMTTIGEEISRSTKTVKKALSGITQVAVNLEMLAINAAIEAARAGEKGRSFSVVADAVKGTASEAKVLVEGIESVNNNNIQMSRNLEDLLEKLH
ncbi:MAG: methyl-accepting chemotaxis protein [Syntrophotaleaceae bacterium]